MKRYNMINNDENFFQHVSQDVCDVFLSQQTPESLQSFPLKINPELFLETLMMKIRGDTIRYSAKKKGDRMSTELSLKHDIEILEYSLQQSSIANPNIQAELDTKKASIEELYNYQTLGAYIRSRAAYKVEGERPTRTFCALEKYNGTQKYVPQLIVTDEDDGEKLITEQKYVENEIQRYYKDLFSNKDDLIDIESVSDFLGQENCNVSP